MNNCTFIGRCGRDAELRHTSNGKAVLRWSIAVDSGFGDNKKTTWIDCALWGDRGEKIADYIKKGDRIGVVGELGTRDHDGKTYIALNVREVTLLGDKKSEDKPAPKREAPKGKPAPQADSFDDDSIPF